MVWVEEQSSILSWWITNMAWTSIIMSNGNPHPYWEYNNAPADPGVGHPHRPLWLKQQNGIRTYGQSEVYTQVRRTSDPTNLDFSAGELSKTFWDNHYTGTLPEPTLYLTFDGTDGSFYNLNWSE